MKDFTVIMAALILIASIVFVYILRKNNLFNVPVVLSIVISSVAMSLGIPYIISAVIDTGLNPALVLFILIMICMVLAFIISIFLSVFINEGAYVRIRSNIGKGFIMRPFVIVHRGVVSSIRNRIKPVREKDGIQRGPEREGTEDITCGKAHENIDTQDILVKNVDRGNIIDKISIENSEQAEYNEQMVLNGRCMKAEISEKLDNEEADLKEQEVCMHEEIKEAAGHAGGQDDIPADCRLEDGMEILQKEPHMEEPREEELQMEEYVNEAFRLKEEGDFESAVLYYMYALDKKPEQDAALWIIADICALYKQLGQVVLAEQMLESYACCCEDEVSIALKADIKRNLLD